jgi:hypothetical protein
MDKRSYIASNINKTDIIDIIIDYGIDHTSNRNGIFINLSVIDDSIIDVIYNKIVESHQESTLTNEEDYNLIINDNKLDTTTSVIKDTIIYSPIDILLLQYSQQTLSI